MYVIETRIKGKRIQIGAYAKSRVYVRISSYSSAYKMSEEDFEQPYYENHMNKHVILS